MLERRPKALPERLLENSRWGLQTSTTARPLRLWFGNLEMDLFCCDDSLSIRKISDADRRGDESPHGSADSWREKSCGYAAQLKLSNRLLEALELKACPGRAACCT